MVHEDRRAKSDAPDTLMVATTAVIISNNFGSYLLEMMRLIWSTFCSVEDAAMVRVDAIASEQSDKVGMLLRALNINMSTVG